MSRKSTIGVLALQGAVREHVQSIEKCGAGSREVKRVAELEGLDGIVIPGGESTTIGKLMTEYGFDGALRGFAADGRGIFGTCAGLILLANRITEGSQPLLGLMDVEVRRNAFGRQRESFEAAVAIPELGNKPFAGVFIRAPWIESVGPGVSVLAEFEGRTVLARQENLLASAFHPELTDDPRLHEYFIHQVVGGGDVRPFEMVVNQA